MKNVAQNAPTGTEAPITIASRDLDFVHSLLDEAERYVEKVIAGHIRIDGMWSHGELTPGDDMRTNFNEAASLALGGIHAARYELDKATGNRLRRRALGVDDISAAAEE